MRAFYRRRFQIYFKYIFLDRFVEIAIVSCMLIFMYPSETWFFAETRVEERNKILRLKLSIFCPVVYKWKTMRETGEQCSRFQQDTDGYSQVHYILPEKKEKCKINRLVAFTRIECCRSKFRPEKRIKEEWCPTCIVFEEKLERVIFPGASNAHVVCGGGIAKLHGSA